MTADHAARAGTLVRGWGRWVLLVTAITQALSPALIGFTEDAVADPVIVPPGPFFAIWWVIIIGCLASAARGLPRARATTGPYPRIHWPLSLTQVAFTAWLIAATQFLEWTVPIFVLMLALLGVCLRVIVNTPADPVTRWLLGTTVGLYAGWSAAAVWLNAASVLPETLASDPVILGVLLAGVVATLVAGTAIFRAEPGFVAAGAWALLGVVISTAWQAPVLGAVTAAGLLLTIGTAVLVQRHDRDRAAASSAPEK